MPAEKSATFRRFSVILMSSRKNPFGSIFLYFNLSLSIIKPHKPLVLHSLNDNMWDDGNSLGPKEIHNYLTRVMYNRRNKFNPLWNTLVLGGVKNGKSYLGMVRLSLSSHIYKIFL